VYCTMTYVHDKYWDLKVLVSRALSILRDMPKNNQTKQQLKDPSFRAYRGGIRGSRWWAGGGAALLGLGL
jgi:hypothetical protein